jgi:hypothetical protein
MTKMSDQEIDRKLQHALRPIRMTDAQRSRHRDALLGNDAIDTGFMSRRSLAELGVIALVVIAIFGGIAWWQQAPGSEDEPRLGAIGSRGATSTPTSSPTGTAGPSPTPTVELLPAFPPSTCPVTRPGEQTFTPPESYPANPPALYDAIWYGSDSLWTMLNPEGEVWNNLPYADNSGTSGRVQKTFWWREGYQQVDEPRPDILVTGQRLDKPGATFSAGSPGTNGMRADIGSFMLVGIEIPTPGCWEITGHYEETTLSYVVWIGTPGH